MKNIFDDEFDEMKHTMSRELFGAFMEDFFNREKGNVLPDTIGADKFFIDGFITENMRYDFWVIARDYLKHHFSNLPEFDKLASYMNASSYQSDPEQALQIRIFSIIYKAAQAGDMYSVSLIRNLYKIYHKREYKQLKRFSKISVSEIFSLAESPDGNVEYEVMARILGMCSIYGIQMEDKCSVLYILLNQNRKAYDEENEIDFYQYQEGLYQKCLEQVDEWVMQESDSKGKYYDYASRYWKVDQFVARCLERFAYPADFLYRCDYEFYDLKHIFAHTLALLKSVYPKEEFTYKEIQEYSHIYKAVSALVSVCDSYDEDMNELFGISVDRHLLDGRECLYKSAEGVNIKNVQKEVKTKTITLPPVVSENADEADYLEEIAELRTRLHKKEEENRNLKMLYDQAKQTLKETKELVEKYKNDREELIALRNHIYQLAEDDVPVNEEKLDVMKSHIAEYNIAVVGGHVNWVNKIKKEFPKWKFFDANISRINDAMLLEGTERLYFFTNHLSHGTYGKYISLVREKKIPFGYLHSVNLDTMIRQIYSDMN